MKINWTLVLAFTVGAVVGLIIGFTREADPPIIGICMLVGAVGAASIYSWEG